MEEPENNQVGAAAAPVVEEQQGTVSAMVSVQQKVAEGIKNCGTRVEDIIVATLVDTEVQRRVELIKLGMGKIMTARKEFNTLNKPDNVSHIPGKDGAFSKVESYTDAHLKAVNAAKTKLETFETALNAALGDNSAEAYNKLSGFVK